MRTRSQLPRQYGNIPSTFSDNSIRIAVSERYRDQGTPGPIRSSKAKRECFKTLRECVGERLEANGRFSDTFETMVTGGYGQEASFIIDPSQRHPRSPTVSQYNREAQNMEREVWPRSKTRQKHAAYIARRLQEFEPEIKQERADTPLPEDIPSTSNTQAMVEQRADSMGWEHIVRRESLQDRILEEQRTEAAALREIEGIYPLWKAWCDIGQGGTGRPLGSQCRIKQDEDVREHEIPQQGECLDTDTFGEEIQELDTIKTESPGSLLPPAL